MLSTLEANFVTEFQISGNATQAYKAAGFEIKSPTQARVSACRLLRKPEIRATLEKHQSNIVKQLVTPNVTRVVSQPKEITLPTREQYLETAWKRQSEESPLKPDLKHKYFETAGRGLNYLRTDDKSDDTKKSVTIILNELNVLNISAPDLPIEPSLPDSTNTAPNIIDVT